MKKLIALILISLLIPIPSASANDKLATIKETSIVTGSTSVTSDIWKGSIPTKVGIRQYSNYLVEFPIQGLLAYETLGAKNSRGTGVTVEFEIWSASGKKLGYDTIYSSSWNPVGPNTSVEFYLFDYPIGTHTLIIRTKYELSTNGLMTTYWEGKIQQAITIYDIDAQAKTEAEAKAKADAEAKAKAEAEAKAKADADFLAKVSEADKARADLLAHYAAEATAAQVEYQKYMTSAEKIKRDSEFFQFLVNGTTCKKLGSKKIAGGATFTCKKINKKLIWKK